MNNATSSNRLESKSAFRLGLLLLIALLLPLPVYLFFAVRLDLWQLFTLAGLATVASAAVGVSLALIRRGHLVKGVWLIIGSILIALFPTALLIADVIVFIGMIALFLILAIVTQALPPHHLNRAITISIIAIALAGLIDLSNPGSQVTFPALQSIIIVAALILLLVYAFITVRAFSDYPLATKLVLSFLAIALIPLGLLAGQNSEMTRVALLEESNANLLSAASQTATALDTFMNSQLSAIRGEARLPIMRSYLSLSPEERAGSPLANEVTVTLHALRSKDEFNITSYALLDAQGNIIADTYLPGIGRNDVNRGHFHLPRDQNLPFYVSPVEFSPSTGVPSLYFSSPIYSPGAEFLGALRVRYNAAILQQIVVQNNLLAGPESYAVLFDENFIYLAHGTAPDARFKTVIPYGAERIAALQSSRRLPSGLPLDLRIDLPDLAQQLQASQTTSFFAAPDVATGPQQINQAASVRLANQPWTVVFFVPQELVLAGVATQNRVALLFALVIAGIVAATAAAMSSLLTRPINELTEVAGNIAKGDLEATAVVQTEDEIGELAQTFNLMTRQLRETLLGLEGRVAERTRALELSSQVSRRLSTILDQQELVETVVDEIQKAFDYYHVHIYLLDEANNTLIMAGGTGEVGRQMLASGHSISVERGLVGRAAATNAAVLTPAVEQDPQWLPNPLLPKTRSEAAVPISVGDRILGVLDVQHHIANGLGQEDVDLLQSMANQVAVALQNARAYEQAQRQAQQEATINRITQRIQSASDVDSALQIAARELGRALQADEAVVKLRRSYEEKNGS